MSAAIACNKLFELFSRLQCDSNYGALRELVALHQRLQRLRPRKRAPEALVARRREHGLRVEPAHDELREETGTRQEPGKKH